MRNRLLLYIVIVVVTFCLILYIRNPDLLKSIWLWLVGLFGAAVAYAESLWKAVKAKALRLIGADQKATTSTAATPSIKPVTTGKAIPIPPAIATTSIPVVTDSPEAIALRQQAIEKDKTIAALTERVRSLESAVKPIDPFTGTSLYLLRYVDDHETTLGLLFLDNKFFCYTLENTFRPVKIAGKTRIPAGDYTVLFNEQLTDLTKKYRGKSFTKGWFTWHLHLQDVPGFQGIYIHPGGDSGDTEGCILVSDGMTSDDRRKVLTNSRKTFETLYKALAEDLGVGIPVRIRIYDEHWFTNEIQNPT